VLIPTSGQAVAVAWSDGTVDVISAETGKYLLKDSTTVHGSQRKPEKSQAKVACLGWGVNFIDVDAVKARTGISANTFNPPKKESPSFEETISGEGKEPFSTDSWDSFRDSITLDDFLQRQPDLTTLDISPDLPDQLAMMDCESLFPKLPVIPVPPANPFARPAAGDTGAFSSQAQIDSIFHSHHSKDHNAVDVLVRCMDDGTVSPTIYDSLSAVSVGLPKEWGVEKSRPLVHASHPYSCSHSILMEISTLNSSSSRRFSTKPSASSTRLVLVPLTLRFISSAGIYLHLIASKTTQLQNLLQYVAQCLQRMRAFWTHAQDLPARFMRNVSETLEEKGEGSLEQVLFHLAVTGSCPPTLREWLVEELTESVSTQIPTNPTLFYSTLARHVLRMADTYIYRAINAGTMPPPSASPNYST
jgi:anaphase-promoting complex subunit 4